MTYLDAEETKRHYQTQMGTELGAAFYAVFAELDYLHAKWADHLVLFGTGPLA
jgi:hypothetical protein